MDISLYSYHLLFVSASIFVLGLYVYYRAPRALLNRFFLLLAIVISLDLFLRFNVLVSPNFEIALFWYKLVPLFVLSSPLVYHFLHLLIKEDTKKENLFFYIALYGPFVIIALLEKYVSDSGPTKTDFGWEWQLNENVPCLGDKLISYSWPVLTLIYFIHLALRIFKFLKTGTDPLRKQQVKIILYGIGLIAICSFLLFTIPGIPNLIALLYLLFMLSFGYAIVKYKLFIVSPKTVALNIVETMVDGLLLLNEQGKILEANNSFLEFGSYEKENVINSDAGLYLRSKNKTKFKGNFADIGNVKDLEFQIKKADGDKIPVSCSVSQIYEGKEHKGTIIIIRDINVRKEMEKELQVSNERLRRMNDSMVGREQKMMELKKENINLKKQIKTPPQ